MKLLTKLLMRQVASGTTVTPVLTATVTSGVAPFGVVFDGVQTTCTDGSINPFHDLLYFFKFGDPSCTNYTNGQLSGKTRNQFAGGPVAAFTYETPGTYTAEMWVSDGVTVWGPVSQSITVTNPDTVYAGTLTTVVSTSGTFTGAPSGATQVTSSDFAAAMTTYAGTNKRVLFRSGETFTAGATSLKSGGTNNMYIGSFGGTPQANINATANNITILQGVANGGNPANNANNWRITGLNINANGFTGINGFTSGIITDATGDANIKNYSKGNIVYHNLTFTNAATALGIGALNTTVSNCTTVGINGGVATTGQLSIFGGGIRVAITNCNLDNNHGGEHVVRMQGSDYGAFISNTLKRPAASKHYAAQRGWAVASGANPLGVDALYNNWAYNTIDGTVATVGTSIWTQICPQNDSQNEPIKDCIWEGNHYRGSRGAPALQITARDVSVRNNTFDQPAYGGELSSDTSIVVYLRAPNVNQTVVNSGIRIYNNSVYRAGIGGISFIKSDNLTGGRIGSVAPIVKGNLVYAPNSLNNGENSGAAPTFETPSTPLPVDAVKAENSADAGIKNTNPLFAGSTDLQSGFALQSGSPYKNAAASYKVRIDALGKLRVGATFDAGALNAPDKQVDAWTLIP